MTGWFKDWFASDDYINVYSHRDDDEVELFFTFLLEKLNISKGSKILDAACGAGRHSIYLHKNGFDIVGFDLSKTLLKIAQENAFKEHHEIKLVNADIRDIYFNSQFDLILNLFTSFGYFESDEENFKFFKNAFNFLKPGGYFVLDYLNKNHLITNLNPRSEEIIAGKKIIQKRKIINGRVEKDIRIESNENTKNNYVESVKLYSADFIISQFENIGYKLIECFGDYDGRPFEESNSSRLITLFKKWKIYFSYYYLQS